MQTLNFSRVGLSCAFAALLVVAAPGVHTSSAAAASGTTVELLNSHLPSGLTLGSADVEQTYDAVKAAVADRPDLAVNILRSALLAKSKRGIKYPLTCPMLVKMVDAAASSAPGRTRDLAEVGLAIDPECSESLDTYLASVNAGALNGGTTGIAEVGEGGLGAGFGPGFPGSPGFVGSAPGGTIALPPGGVAVTPFANN